MSSRKKNTAKHPAFARPRTKRTISFPPSVKVKLDVFPTPENFILRLEKEYPGAKLAFKTLTADGADPKDLRSVLLGMALHLTLDAKVCSDRLTGLPRHTLKRFPEKLNAIAGVVEKINDSQLANPSRWVAPQNFWDRIAEPKAGIREHVAADFRQLPALLRLYAEYVKGRSRFIGKMRVWRGVDVSKVFRVRLLEFVRGTTGRAHNEEVSILLTAIYYLAGQHRIFYPQELTKLYKRNLRLRMSARR